MIMKVVLHKIYMILVFSIIWSFSNFATSYYVDASIGKDTNSGKSPRSTWATLKKVNTTIFKPSDQILYKSGTSYNDQLEPKGTVLKEDPLLLIITTHKTRTNLINI